MTTTMPELRPIEEIARPSRGMTAPQAFLGHRGRRTRTSSRCARCGARSRAVGRVDLQRVRRADVAKAAAGLRHARRSAPGERVLLMMRNRPDFHWFDAAAQFLRATPVSIYNSSSPEEIQYLAGHAEAEVAIVEDAGFLERILKVRDELPELEQIFVIDPPADGLPDGVLPAAELLGQGSARPRRAGRRDRTRRPGHADLHVRHHRPAEGRDDQPGQRGLHRRAAPPLLRRRARLRRASGSCRTCRWRTSPSG